MVKRRKWLDDQEFLDLMGATNLNPGPNSTEMAIHLSYLRAGWRGLIVGGLCFILPAMIIVIVLNFFQLNELFLLFSGGLVVMLVSNIRDLK